VQHPNKLTFSTELFVLRGFGIAIAAVAQRSRLVKYALMGVSFFLLVWVGTFFLMV